MDANRQTFVLVEERRLQALESLLERRLFSIETRINEFMLRLPDERVPLEDPLLTVQELAELLRCDPRTVRRLELSGDVPVGIRIGGSKRWRTSDVRQWLDGLDVARDGGRVGDG